MNRMVKVCDLEQWAVIRPIGHAQWFGYGLGETQIVSEDEVLVLVAHREPDWLYRAVTLDGRVTVELRNDALVCLVEPGDRSTTDDVIVVDLDAMGRLKVAHNAGMLDLRNQTEVRMEIPPMDVLGWAPPKRKYTAYIYNRVAEMLDADTTHPCWQQKIDLEYSENEVFDMVLRYEGIIGYSEKVLGLVEDIFKVKNLRRVNY